MEGLLHHTDLTILLRSFLAHRSDSLFNLFDKSFLPAILQNRTEGNAGECRLPLCILLTSLVADNRGYNGIIPLLEHKEQTGALIDLPEGLRGEPGNAKHHHCHLQVLNRVSSVSSNKCQHPNA